MQEITEQSFQKEVQEQKGVVVVDFYTSWCHPCKQVAPVLEELDKDMEKVTFVKVNAEESPNLAAQFGVRSVPTLVVLKDGQVKNTIMGVQPKEVLREKILALST